MTPLQTADRNRPFPEKSPGLLRGRGSLFDMAVYRLAVLGMTMPNS